MTSLQPATDFLEREKLYQLQSFAKDTAPKMIPGVYGNLSDDLIHEVIADVLGLVLYNRFPEKKTPEINIKWSETEIRLACKLSATTIGEKTSKDIEMILRFLPLYVKKAQRRIFKERIHVVRNVTSGLIPNEAQALITEPDDIIDNLSFPYNADMIDEWAELPVLPYDDYNNEE